MAKAKSTSAPASLKALAATPAKAVTSITGLKVAELLDAVKAKAFTKQAAAAELTRRIEQRAAAGKHPMPFVIAARDELVAA
jgi:hypothetical protein